MGWVRAKYQLQWSSDGFSKSTPVILPKTFNLLRKSQKSNVNQQKVYMPKKYVENPPTPQKFFGVVIIIVLIACKFLEQSEQLYKIEDFWCKCLDITTVRYRVVHSTSDLEFDFLQIWSDFGCFSLVTRLGGFKSLCKCQKWILHQILRFYSGGENFLAVFQLENMKKPRFWSKIQLISLI